MRDRGGEVTIFSRSVPRAQKLLRETIQDVPVVVGDYAADQSVMTVNGDVFDAFGVMFGFEAVVPEGLVLDLGSAMYGLIVLVKPVCQASMPVAR
ncbi:MAG: hypothetical protein PW788_15675 [Micavibrio sp.]|nr:hypothetical protein [Micavibrio sp.]